MRGIDTGALSPETGLRVKRYQLQLAAEVSAVTISLGSVKIKGIVPNSPASAVRRGRVIRCSLIGGTAAAGAGEFTPNFSKVIAAGNGLPAACVGDIVPLQTLGVATSATLAAFTPFEYTEAQMAPDEREHSNLRGVTGTATGATTTTQLAASANGNYDQFYSGSLIRRLDTGEGQIITNYAFATKIATHAAWTLGTAIAPAGTPYIIRHDNRIVRPNDVLQCLPSAVGAGTQPTLTWFSIEVLELATYNENNFA